MEKEKNNVDKKSILIDKKIHRQLKEHCIKNNLIMNRVVQDLIMEYLKRKGEK